MGTGTFCLYCDIEDFLEISRESVEKRANKDHWQKKVSMAALVDKAHAADDPKISLGTANQWKDSGLVVDRLTLVGGATTSPAAVGKQVYKALKSQENDGSKLAKVAAEMFKLVEDSEHKVNFALPFSLCDERCRTMHAHGLMPHGRGAVANVLPP